MKQLSQCTWSFAFADDAFQSWFVHAVAAIVRGVCGVEIRTTDDAESADILVGTASALRLTAGTEPGGPGGLSSLGPEDFILKTLSRPGSERLVVAGGGDRGTSYGVFELLERVGCRFLVSGDRYPDPRKVELPSLDVSVHCPNPIRAVWISHCVTTTSMLSLPDYEALLDQMVKMRLNRIIFYHFDSDPYVDYAYRGERKLVGDIADPESGYISYGRFHGSYRVEDIEIGRERFGDRLRVAPEALQRASSSAEALDAARELMRGIMAAGKRRKIEVWMHILPQFIAPNLSKYTRPMPRRHPHWSYWVSCTDPVAREINRERVRSLLDSYPDLAGLSLGIPEGFFDDPYPESLKLIERRLPEYQEALDLQQRYWGEFWKGKELQEAHIRADIAFTEILLNTVTAVRELDPTLPLAVTTVCKAYLLVKLHELLDKDIAFFDIESSSLWTLGGAPLHLFRRMEGRDCALIPRAVDDGSMAGMQFNLGLYDRDGFVRSTTENGTRGFVIQVTHISGNEHNVDYLRRGLWQPDLAIDGYYEEYARAIFGPEAAAPVAEAFGILDRNEVELGGRGAKNMPWNQQPGEIAALRALRDFDRKFYACPFSEAFVRSQAERAVTYREAAGRLAEAEGFLRKALPLCRPSGREHLEYLLERNGGYISHLEALAGMIDAFGAYRDAFMAPRDPQAIRAGLAETVTRAAAAHAHARCSAEHFASCARHPSDLGVLWSINISMVKGTRLFQRYLESVLAFYEGRDYWFPLEWDTVFGTPVFPTYELREVTDPSGGGYEPG